MAQTVHVVTLEVESVEDKPRNEPQVLWLELEVPSESPRCESDLASLS